MHGLVVLHPLPAALTTPEGWAGVRGAVAAHVEAGARVVVVAPALAGGAAAVDRILTEAMGARHEATLAAWGAAWREVGAALGLDAAPVVAAEVGELARHALSTSVMAGIRPATHARARALPTLATARLLGAALGAPLADPRGLFRTRPGQGADHYLRGRPLLPRREPDVVDAALGTAPVTVIPGGLGLGPDQEPVLVAGGEAVTAAILAARAGADRVEVHGAVPLSTARPEWTRGARPVGELAPAEARELAALGWEGLQADAVGLLASEGIELVLAGPSPTRVTAAVDPVDGARLLHVTEGLHGLAVDPDDPVDLALPAVVAALTEHGARVARLVSGSTGITVVLRGDPDPALADELARLGRVATLPDLVALTLVGSGLRSLWHQVGPALEAVGRPRLRLVAEGADDRTLTLVVDAGVAEPVARALHGRVIPPG